MQPPKVMPLTLRLFWNTDEDHADIMVGKKYLCNTTTKGEYFLKHSPTWKGLEQKCPMKSVLLSFLPAM